MSVFWTLFCAFLVLLMQIGFLLIEAGSVRRKNSASVSFKNIFDYFVCFFIFYFWGIFFLKFSLDQILSLSFFSQFSTFFLELTTEEVVNSIYQAGFACTACTIVSGAVAERTDSKAYIVFTVLVSLICYPIVLNWVWSDNGFLNERGFVDLAGASVVHALGGVNAFVFCFLLGPRLGGDLKRKEVTLTNNDQVQIVFGGFLLSLCWLGFNGGAVSFESPALGKIIANTALGGAAAFMTSFLFFGGVSRRKQVPISTIVNGSLGGLVSVTAGAHLFNIFEALLVAAIGATIVMLSDKFLRNFIDDVVGAVSVHLFGGVWGVVSVGVFVSEVSLIEQIFGIFIIVLFCFIFSLLVLGTFNRIRPLRVSSSSEKQGLNYSEFGVKDELGEFFTALDKQVLEGTYGVDISYEPNTIIGDMTYKYNEVSKSFKAALESEKDLKVKLVQQSSLAATGELASGIAHEINNPLAIIKATVFTMRKLGGKKKLSDEMLVNFMGDIENTVDRIAKIITSLKNITRDTSSSTKEHFPVIELVEEVEALIEIKSKAKGVQVSFNIRNDQFSVTFDRVQLSQVLVNLISNAIDAVAENDDNWVQVEGSVALNEKFYEFKIIDSGRGISKDVQAKMFNPFFTTKDVGKGTGLGLSLVKKIMELNNGDIYYNEAEGNTCFSVKVPSSKESS